MWADHVLYWLTIVCRPKAMLEGNVCCWLTVVCRPKEMQAFKSRRWQRDVHKPRSIWVVQGGGRLSIMKATANVGTLCPTSAGRMVKDKGDGGRPNLTTSKWCAQVMTNLVGPHMTSANDMDNPRPQRPMSRGWCHFLFVEVACLMLTFIDAFHRPMPMFSCRCAHATTDACRTWVM